MSQAGGAAPLVRSRRPRRHVWYKSATKAGPTEASAADQGGRRTNHRKPRKN